MTTLKHAIRMVPLMECLYKLGAPDRAIERITGCSSMFVRTWRHNHNLPIQANARVWFGKCGGTKRGEAPMCWEETVPIRLREVAMTPPCPLKIQEERHCVQRQLGNVRLFPSTGKPRAMFQTCFTCPHWIPEKEWKAKTGNKRRVYDPSRVPEVGMSSADRVTRNYIGSQVEGASQKTARRLL